MAANGIHAARSSLRRCAVDVKSCSPSTVNWFGVWIVGKDNRSFQLYDPYGFLKILYTMMFGETCHWFLVVLGKHQTSKKLLYNYCPWKPTRLDSSITTMWPPTRRRRRPRTVAVAETDRAPVRAPGSADVAVRPSHPLPGRDAPLDEIRMSSTTGPELFSPWGHWRVEPG